VSATILAVVVTFAAVGAAYLMARATVAILPAPSSVNSRWLFAQGVGPTLLACAIALGLVLPAFLLFEPAHSGERAGVMLVMLAVIGFAHLARVAVRAARMLWLSRALIARWTSGATPLEESRWGLPVFAIDAGFPVVAVAGLFRSRLFVDRRVLNACSPGELDAIAAHERAHVARRDNLRRLLVGACEGPTSATAAEWRGAAEHAADRRAADSPHRAVNLASALVKIARLEKGRVLEATALSTIHDGGSLEARVRHLVGVEPTTRAERDTSLSILVAVLPAAIVVGLNWSSLLRSVHSVTEAAVNYLP
jgi:Zn-dependent protease with chaperone function